jgi:hypothetical protein
VPACSICERGDSASIYCAQNGVLRCHLCLPKLLATLILSGLRVVATCGVKAYFSRMSANLLLMEANSSHCASVLASLSQVMILFSRLSAPANAQPYFSSSNVIPVSRSCPRPRSSALAPQSGLRPRLASSAPECGVQPAFGVNNSGSRRLAGAASKRLEFISVAVSSMRRSPPQVGVLTTRRARHTIIYPERASPGSRCSREPLRRQRASAAFNARFGRGIFLGVLSIGTAHFRSCS